MQAHADIECLRQAIGGHPRVLDADVTREDVHHPVLSRGATNADQPAKLSHTACVHAPSATTEAHTCLMIARFQT
eukprot:15451476-Alexandrium_andersonii.AAC.1